MAKLKRGQIQRGLRTKHNKPPAEESGSILDKVEGELKREGIVPFENNDIMEEYLQLPADLTESTSKELGRYFNTFTKQKMYCRTMLGRVSAILREQYEEIDELRGIVYKSLPVKMSVKEKELSLLADEDYGSEAKALVHSITKLEEKKNMLSLYLDNLVDGIFNISREISRRESDWFDEKRENSIENKRRR